MYRDAFSLLLALDSTTNPGLTKKQLQSILTRCTICSLFTMKRTFKYHQCLIGLDKEESDDEKDVIDLTMVDDDEDVVIDLTVQN